MELTALAPTRTRMSQVHLSTNKTWTKEEDALLTQIATHSETISWRTIAQYFPNKTAPQLAGRWEKVLNPTLIKGSWTREEDEIILRFVAENGDKDWAKLALLLRGRTGKQCRERFKNHLDPNVSKLTWTEEEDNRLIDLHNKYGNAWTKIATFFEGRTDNCIKNRWNSTLKKRLERLEKGEPLVMKRGRKPKGYYDSIPKPELIDTNIDPHDLSAGCSSPIHPPIKPPMMDIVPIAASFPLFIRREDSSNQQQHKEKISLEKNRQDLANMLQQALA